LVNPESSGADQTDSPDSSEVPWSPEFFYDYYSSVSLFERGVYFVATSEDPLTQLPRSDLPKSYWELMRDNVTVEATDQDFISVLVCRGDFPTGGYKLAVEAFSWLESYPVKLRFQVNFTDPGEGVIVSQAFTNPTLLVPIGELDPGEYKVEIHIVSYVLTFDEQGKPVYTPIMTFKEEVWTETLTVTSSHAPESSTTFSVVVNNNPFSDLTVPVDLSTGLTQEKAELIAKATFVHVKGEETLFRLDDLTFTDKEITARFTWGVDESDMGHIFELTADLTALQITVNHCF
jgi:subtilisin family serine protease